MKPLLRDQSIDPWYLSVYNGYEGTTLPTLFQLLQTSGVGGFDSVSQWGLCSGSCGIYSFP